MIKVLMGVFAIPLTSIVLIVLAYSALKIFNSNCIAYLLKAIAQ
jgi:hypothetical protein